MSVLLATHAGFCFGVRRAVQAAEQAAPALSLGPIIHNPQVVAQLDALGIRSVATAEEVPTGARVVIRSHGVSRAVMDTLTAQNCEIVDATCPFVSRIHAMAREAMASHTPLIVVGEGRHPEVIGILGWTDGERYAVNSPEDVEALPPLDRAVIVSQTTMAESQFQMLCALLKDKVANPDIRATICPATHDRQSECVDLATRSQVMIVIGGRDSSNSRKLYRLAADICARTEFIETASELDGIQILPSDTIGITAGASTPDCIIKEVVARMNDIEKKVTLEETNEQGAMSMEDVEATLVQIRPGQILTGTVVQITEDEVCVNVGYKSDGLVKMTDLSSTDVKVGDEIEVEVVKVNDGEGNVVLSQKNIIDRKAWEEICAKEEAGEFVEAVGKEAVKGGLLAEVCGIRTFIPASQLSLRYVEKIDEFVGQTMTLKIIEIDRSKKRIVASRKAVLMIEETEKKKKIWETLEVGSVVTGIVRRLADFGAFVDIGGVDGLVHVTDLSWGRVKHPSDVVAVGQQIEVKILNVDPERERISLSLKQTMPRPWTVADQKYPVGSIVEGKVVRITTFGAFVELEPGLDGLVHISQCALTRIAKVEDAVSVDDIVRVKVLDVNTEAKRISLSIREVLEEEAFENMPVEDIDGMGVYEEAVAEETVADIGPSEAEA
ncbi:MAG: bifunctional 4-hydroxy-3-methylbut-2-enyl diphosphate reductase/30S ribosomal protein S1 [Christensenellales bacterium]|nr:bifunctional 4-hydroxy-3-methylbut-2-enyl diphosphate reductase/30S ribosomal protein S1 [Christensenellales bacterium]